MGAVSKKRLAGKALCAGALLVSCALLWVSIAQQPARHCWLLLLATLWAAARCDWRSYLIPNAIPAVALALRAGCLAAGALGTARIVEGLGAEEMLGAGTADFAREALGAGACGAALAGFALAVALAVEWVCGRAALGGGDVKLLFAVGTYLPLSASASGLVLASLFGLMLAPAIRRRYGNAQAPIPFAVAMLPAYWLAMLAA